MNNRLKRLKKVHEVLLRQEAEALDTIPATSSERGPGVDGVPVSMDYSDRGPGDIVIAGPLGRGETGEPRRGLGRWFDTAYEALAWARGKYGERVNLIHPSLEEGAPRWAVLVKNLRK